MSGGARPGAEAARRHDGASRMVVRRSRWLSLSAAVLRGSQLILLALVLVSAVPAEYGELSMAIAINGIAVMIAQGGLVQSSATASRISASAESSLAMYGWSVGAAGYALLLPVCWSIGSLADMPHVLHYSSVLGVAVLLAPPTAVSTGKLQRAGAFRTLGLTQVAGSGSGLAVGAAFLLLGHPITALVVQSVTSQVLAAGAVLLHPAGRVRPLGRLADSRAERAVARHALAANALGVVGRRLDDILVGAVLGAPALGQYSLGYRVLSVSTELMLHPVESVSLAEAAGWRSDPSHVRGLMRRSQIRMARRSCPVFVGLALASWLVVPRALGDEWHNAGTVAALLSIAGAVQATYWLTYPTLFVTSGAAVALKYQVWQVGVLLTGIVVGLGSGTTGVAAGYLIGSVVLGLSARWILREAERRSSGAERSLSVGR